MSQLRQPFSELSPEVYKGLVQASLALEKSELGSALVELVYLRVSQINGCAFCLEKHSQALRKGGRDSDLVCRGVLRTFCCLFFTDLN